MSFIGGSYWVALKRESLCNMNNRLIFVAVNHVVADLHHRKDFPVNRSDLATLGHLRVSLVDVPLSHTLQKYASVMLRESARKIYDAREGR
jgi:hypothetical protein